MSDLDAQLRHVCQWNHQLSAVVRRLREQLRARDRRIAQLETDNADLLAKHEALDTMLGAAMDAALGEAA